MENKQELKMNQIKEGHVFSDGSILRKKYFFNTEEKMIIYLDENNEVRYKLGTKKENCLSKLKRLSGVVSEMISLPTFLKNDLNLRLAYIYKLSFDNMQEQAEQVLEEMNKIIIERQRTVKKMVYLFMPIIITLLLQVNRFFNNDYANLLTAIGIGNVFSNIFHLKRKHFEGTEPVLSYVLYSIYKYLIAYFVTLIVMFLQYIGVLHITIDISKANVETINIFAILGFVFGLISPNIPERNRKD